MSVNHWAKALGQRALLVALVSGAIGLGVSLQNEVAQANVVYVQPGTAVPQQVVLLREAIVGQESGANFLAVNPHSGALGYGQVMPENLPSWSMEALGYVVSAQEFLQNPILQVAIIEYKLNQYWQQSLWLSKGDEELAIRRVASWWYSGKPDRYTSNQPQFYKGHRYPSIAAYSLAVLRRYQRIAGRTAPLVGLDAFLRIPSQQFFNN